MHPRYEAIDEAPDILAVKGVGLVLEIVDDVHTHGQLLLGVRGAEVRGELLQSRHLDAEFVSQLSLLTNYHRNFSSLAGGENNSPLYFTLSLLFVFVWQFYYDASLTHITII